LIDAVFSPQAVCLSEGKRGIRLFDLATGEMRWHLNLALNRLAYNVSDQRFYSMALAITSPHNRSLIRLASSLLECEQILALGKCWEGAFTPSGRALVTVQGDVYETSTGTLLAHLDFPQRDYTDDSAAKQEDSNVASAK
jgi:hypothetical protein